MNMMTLYFAASRLQDVEERVAKSCAGKVCGDRRQLEGADNAWHMIGRSNMPVAGRLLGRRRLTAALYSGLLLLNKILIFNLI